MSTVPTPAPPVGSMYLFDCVTPPLVDGSYRIDVATNVTFDGQQAPLSSNSGYFDIEGPRFTLPATDVASVFPPRNGHGGFDEFLPADRDFTADAAVGTAADFESQCDRHSPSRARIR